MQNRAHHRDCKEALQISRGLPVHDRNSLAWGDPDFAERRGQAVNTFAEFAVDKERRTTPGCTISADVSRLIADRNRLRISNGKW
jgi:hypothetical protein